LVHLQKVDGLRVVLDHKHEPVARPDRLVTSCPTNWSVGVRGCRNRERKRAADTQLTVDPEPSAVELDEAARQRQT
jgi:hypothetical protein